MLLKKNNQLYVVTFRLRQKRYHVHTKLYQVFRDQKLAATWHLFIRLPQVHNHQFYGSVMMGRHGQLPTRCRTGHALRKRPQADISGIDNFQLFKF